MRPEGDELSAALEGLRNRPIVTESRDYARRWERSRARMAYLRRVAVGKAGVFAAIACVMVLVVFGVLPMLVNPAGGKVTETGVGETRALALEDGSRVVLDTSSRLRVVFTATARDVELLDGQAHFEVAKDAHRPFRVRTRSAEVVAVGTMFDVAALPTRTTVTLIEGRVNVRTIALASRVEPRVEALAPGQQVGITGDGQLLETKVVNIENVTAWQRGTIVLDDVSVPEALRQLNRYSTTRIAILGESLQSKRVSGVFRTGDVETEVSALERYFDLQEASRSSGEIVLADNHTTMHPWRSLLDDKSLSAWRGWQSANVPEGWHLVGDTLSKEGAVDDLVTRQEFGNFELELEWKIGKGGNSGILYRGTREYDHIYWSAPEYQLLDDANHPDGRNQLTAAGSAYALYAPPAGVVKPFGQWNTTRIVVNGAHVEHWLNGQKVVTYELWSPDWKARVAGSKFAAYPSYGLAKEGYLAIQGDHTGALELRHIRIRELP